ncbi:hypothetical protein KB976_004447 [Vibrio parahaemolyticus]|nr:hypothetical protein [Vibrio parahaemolyticus]
MKKIVWIILFVSSIANADILNDLNERFHNTVDSCEGETPAYYCSGVLIRATGSSDGYYPWNPSPNATELGSVSFSYLRNDIKINDLWGNNGYIFKSQSDAISENTAINYRCSYPYEAVTANRGQNGCGELNIDEQENNCYLLGVQSLYSWSEFIIQKNSHISSAQCSFDATNALEFILSLKAHDVGRFDLDDSIITGFGVLYNEILLEVWEQNQPVPLEAFWYMSGDEDALNNALYDRERYLEVTGNYVEIVELDLTNLHTPFINIFE